MILWFWNIHIWEFIDLYLSICPHNTQRFDQNCFHEQDAMNYELHPQQLQCEQISVKFKPNTISFIHENIFQNGGCKMAAILSGFQGVNKHRVAIKYL